VAFPVIAVCDRVPGYITDTPFTMEFIKTECCQTGWAGWPVIQGQTSGRVSSLLVTGDHWSQSDYNVVSLSLCLLWPLFFTLSVFPWCLPKRTEMGLKTLSSWTNSSTRVWKGPSLYGLLLTYRYAVWKNKWNSLPFLVIVVQFCSPCRQVWDGFSSQLF
jgi:hypothetical protein